VGSRVTGRRSIVTTELTKDMGLIGVALFEYGTITRYASVIPLELGLNTAEVSSQR
jgi:hypothetical protein